MADAPHPFETSRHIGELAELYALGALEVRERAAVEAHAAHCARCSRALGEAEMAIAALDDAFVPEVEPPSRLGTRIAASAGVAAPPLRRAARPRAPFAGVLAAAAALALAVGIGAGTFVEREGQSERAAREGAVLATIATSHFYHVSFTAKAAGAPIAKALYARDGAWFYVIVASASCECRLIARSSSGERDLGVPQRRGAAATLFVRDFPRPTTLELVNRSGGVVSSASLVY
jgi:hypothetical protein